MTEHTSGPQSWNGELALNKRSETLRIIKDVQKEIEMLMIETESKEGIHDRKTKIKALKNLHKTLPFYIQKLDTIGYEIIARSLKDMRKHVANLLEANQPL